MKLNINDKKREVNLPTLNAHIPVLTPVLTDKSILHIQDFIENFIVEYSKEDVANETFLEFSAEHYPCELEGSEKDDVSTYEFSLFYKGKAAINVSLSLSYGAVYKTFYINKARITIAD